MDMFRHAEGAYAGVSAEINAYTPSHSFETDAVFIQACLRHFSGELVSHSAAFSELAREATPDTTYRLVDASGE